MTTARYLLGDLLLLVVVAALGVAAVHARRWAVPDWRGAPARMVEALLAVAVLLALAQVVGVLGVLRTAPLVGGCVAIAGVAVTVAARGSRSGDVGPPAAPPPPRVGVPGVVVSLVACGALAIRWGDRLWHSATGGMSHLDTLTYHGPIAARFVQEASITEPHFTFSEPHATYFPASSELLHAVGILIFDSDFLSLTINFGWLALALLGAWCFGRSRGLGAVSLAAAAVVLASPKIVTSQAADAKNDIVVIALLLCAGALLVEARGRRSVLLLAALAVSMAVGFRLTAAPAALVLLAALPFLARRGERAATAALTPVIAVAAGGYWYVRNAVLASNPLPFTDGIGPITLPTIDRPVLGRHDISVADTIGDGEFWAAAPDALRLALGPGWAAMLALAGAGLGLAVIRGPRELRVVGAVGLAGLAAYLVTPTTAGEDGAFFFAALRYTTPFLALGLVLLATSVAHGKWRPIVLAATALLVVLTAGGPYGWEGEQPAVLIGVSVVAVLAVGVALRLRSRLTRRAAAVGAVVGVVIAATAGAVVHERYLDLRYAYADRPDLAALYAWSRTVRDARIGTVYFVQYPLYGTDLSNRVEWVGRRRGQGDFGPARSCIDWWRILRRERYRYVVTGPVTGTSRPPEHAWTRSSPTASEIVRVGAVSVFRLDRSAAPNACHGTLRG